MDEKYNECNFGLIHWLSFAPKANYVAEKVLTDHLTGAKFQALYFGLMDANSKVAPKTIGANQDNLFK